MLFEKATGKYIVELKVWSMSPEGTNAPYFQFHNILPYGFLKQQQWLYCYNCWKKAVENGHFQAPIDEDQEGRESEDQTKTRGVIGDIVLLNTLFSGAYYKIFYGKTFVLTKVNFHSCKTLLLL